MQLSVPVRIRVERDGRRKCYLNLGRGIGVEVATLN